MSRKTRREQPRHSAGSPAVTPERRTHGPIEIAKAQIFDSNDAIGRPYVALDLLTRMFRAGAIDAEMKRAGDEFYENFRRAQLDGRRCADIGRVFGSGRAETDSLRVVIAKRAVNAAVAAVGTPGDSILWNVIGLEMTIKDWSRDQSWAGQTMNPMRASGILVCALGVLAGQSAPAPRMHRSARTPVVAAVAARVAAR